MSLPNDPRLRPSVRTSNPSPTAPRRARGGCLLVGVLVAALCGAALWLYPPLLLGTVDAVRDVVGPAPVAYVETYAFELGTLVRRARVAAGDTAPRWRLEVAPVARPTTADQPTTNDQRPTTNDQRPTPNDPSPTPNGPLLITSNPSPTTNDQLPITNYQLPITTTPSPEVAPLEIIRRGGNMRTEPRVASETVIGLLWAGDQVAVLERQDASGEQWYRVRVQQPAAPRGGAGVPAGQEGWMSAVLLTAAPTVTPTPDMLLQPSPAPLVPPTTLPAALATRAPEPAAPAPPSVAPTKKPIVVQPPAAPAAPRADWPPPPLPALIDDGQLPGEGAWQLLGALGDGGDARMAVTVLRPDPARPDIQVALVAVDMTRAALHLVAGTEEPPVISGTTTVRTGVIAPDVQQSGTLLAAFNGGFKAVHGTDGMAADGEVYLPPVKGRATLAVFDDGSLRLGLWGREFDANDALVAWRQNGHLLVDGGAVTDRARQGGLGWGATVDLQAETWRSGVGLNADGRTLFYAVGDGLTAPRLAEVLRAAGSQTAMQLDINNWWVRFVTFQAGANARPLAQPLISAMPREPRKYLVADRRDFFYLTAR